MVCETKKGQLFSNLNSICSLNCPLPRNLTNLQNLGIGVGQGWGTTIFLPQLPYWPFASHTFIKFVVIYSLVRFLVFCLPPKTVRGLEVLSTNSLDKQKKLHVVIYQQRGLDAQFLPCPQQGCCVQSHKLWTAQLQGSAHTLRLCDRSGLSGSRNHTPLTVLEMRQHFTQFRLNCHQAKITS